MDRIRACLIVICALTMSTAWSDDAPATMPTSHPGEAVLIFEGHSLLNSGLAAADPQVAGGIILVTTPLAFAEDRDHGAQLWVGAGGYAAIGAFDVSQRPDYSRSKVFAENFALWNLWGGVMLAMQLRDGDGKAAKLARHVSVTPQPDGGVRVAYHWTF
jgi:hypothetical protein